MLKITANELFDYFQEHKICESLTRAEVEVFTNYLQEKSYKAHEVISGLGDIGDSMYFIYSGKVAFTSFDGQDEADIGKQETGSLVGEMSFFDGVPRQLKMSAGRKPAMLIEITRAMYDRLKVEQPFIAVNLLENAVVSLDRLVRSVSQELSHIEHYMKGFGRH